MNMPKDLLIDGVRFKSWVPEPEETIFQPIVREHINDILGGNARYIDISHRLRSEGRIGSEPDGFAIDPTIPKLYIVEVELSQHDPYKHINDQLTRFINGLNNFVSKNEVVDALFDYIEGNKNLHGYFEEKVKTNLHKWLWDLVNKKPTIVVVIEEKTPQVLEACSILRESFDTRILEFQTFRRENAPTVQAYLFEPLSSLDKQTSSYNEKIRSSEPTPAAIARGQEYLKFYEELANRLKQKVPTAIAKPAPRYYCYITTVLGSVHFEWLFWGNPRSSFGVELHFERRPKEANLTLIRKLEKYKEDVERATGETVFFQENWGTICSRIYLVKKEGQMTEELKTWAVDKMALFYNFLEPKLEEIKRQPIA